MVALSASAELARGSSGRNALQLFTILARRIFSFAVCPSGLPFLGCLPLAGVVGGAGATERWRDHVGTEGFRSLEGLSDVTVPSAPAPLPSPLCPLTISGSAGLSIEPAAFLLLAFPSCAVLLIMGSECSVILAPSVGENRSSIPFVNGVHLK